MTPICLLALTLAPALSACNANPQNTGQAAGQLMTRIADATPGTPQPTATPGPSPTPIPPVVYARCIVRAENEVNMYLEPDDLTPITAQLANREIITAYGRTADANWILGWNAASTTGWVSSRSIGCTVPVQELRPTVPTTLLTPLPGATQVAAAPTAEKVTATPAAAIISPIATPGKPTPTVAEPSPAMTAMTMTPTTEVTPTAGAEVTATVQATSTVVVTATVVMTEIKCAVTPGTPVNLRRGPGRTFRIIATLRSGAEFNASGRNQDSTWLSGTTARGTKGWLIATAVKCEGAVESLPVTE